MSDTEKVLEPVAQISEIEFALHNTIEKLAALKEFFDRSVPVGVTADSVQSAPAFQSSSGRSPLETLDSLARRITVLMSSNAQISDDLQPISDELIGLREDIAHVFHEVKTGSNTAAAAAAASEARDKKVDQTFQKTNTRLDSLEERSPP